MWSRDDRYVPDKKAFSKRHVTNLKRQAVQVPAEACLARLPQRLDKAGNSALRLRTTSQTFNSSPAFHQHNLALTPFYHQARTVLHSFYEAAIVLNFAFNISRQ